MLGSRQHRGTGGRGSSGAGTPGSGSQSMRAGGACQVHAPRQQPARGHGATHASSQGSIASSTAPFVATIAVMAARAVVGCNRPVTSPCEGVVSRKRSATRDTCAVGSSARGGQAHVLGPIIASRERSASGGVRVMKDGLAARESSRPAPARWALAVTLLAMFGALGLLAAQERECDAARDRPRCSINWWMRLGCEPRWPRSTRRSRVSSPPIGTSSCSTALEYARPARPSVRSKQST